MAASRSDSAVLGANTLFIARVQAALASACINIFSEGTAVANHRDRVALVHQVLSNPTNMLAYATAFAIAVATDANVLGDATSSGTVVLDNTNVGAKQALVTDAHMDTAVSGMFNAFCSQIPA